MKYLLNEKYSSWAIALFVMAGFALAMFIENSVFILIVLGTYLLWALFGALFFKKKKFGIDIILSFALILALYVMDGKFYWQFKIISWALCFFWMFLAEPFYNKVIKRTGPL